METIRHRYKYVVTELVCSFFFVLYLSPTKLIMHCKRQAIPRFLSADDWLIDCTTSAVRIHILVLLLCHQRMASSSSAAFVLQVKGSRTLAAGNQRTLDLLIHGSAVPRVVRLYKRSQAYGQCFLSRSPAAGDPREEEKAAVVTTCCILSSAFFQKQETSKKGKKTCRG